MVLNQRQVDIIWRLYELNIGLAEGNDDQRRVLTRKIAEQICYEFGVDWGTKASSSTNPQSKDSISFRSPNKLENWDWQNGTTRKPQVTAGEPGVNITGQYFIEVRPMNHLADTTELPPPPNGNGDEGHEEIMLKLNEMQNQLNTMQQTLDQHTVMLQTIIDKLTFYWWRSK